MSSNLHPTFGQWLRRFLLRACIGIAFPLVVGLALLNNGYSALGRAFAIAFEASIVWVVVYLVYKLYHVECPVCGKKMKTTRTFDLGSFVARCSGCATNWNLGVEMRD